MSKCQNAAPDWGCLCFKKKGHKGPHWCLICKKTWGNRRKSRAKKFNKKMKSDGAALTMYKVILEKGPSDSWMRKSRGLPVIANSKKNAINKTKELAKKHFRSWRVVGAYDIEDYD